MWDAIISLTRLRTHPEEATFLLSLAQKAPLLVNLPPEIVGQFWGSDAISPSKDGDALVLCAHTGAIAISVALTAAWQADRIKIAFDEIDELGGTMRVEDEIDHLSYAAHAPLIIARHQASLRAQTTLTNFWHTRGEAFPSLRFSPEVERQLDQLNKGVFDQILTRLSELEDAAAEWPVIGGPAPIWRSKTSPEGEHRATDAELMKRMTFLSLSGQRLCFEWHARYGSAGRIHLRFNPTDCTVEIGYIGKKIV